MNKIPVLTRQREIELLRQAKKGKTAYDVLGTYHTDLKEQIQEAFDNKVKEILGTYYEDKRELKKILSEQNSVILLKLTEILNKDKSQKGKENKIRFKGIKKAYEILSDEQKKTAYDEKNKELFLVRNKAVRLLIFHNQSFVKYWVRRFHYYPQNDIDSEDLVLVGTAALLDAIKEFDLSKAGEYCLATYAGGFIERQANELIKESQLVPRIIKERFCDFCKKIFKINELRELKKSPDEQGKKYICKKCLEELKDDTPNSPIWQNWSIVYYNKNYYDNEKDGSGSFLADTLKDDDSEEQIEQQKTENKIRTDELISNLEYHEELIIRLYFGLVPNNLTQIFRLATEEKQRKIKKTKKDFFPLEKKFTSSVEKYHRFLSAPWKNTRQTYKEKYKSAKKEAVFQQIIQPEFWEYFREFPDEINCKHCKLVDNELESSQPIKIKKEGEKVKHGFEQERNWTETPCAKDFQWPADFKGKKKVWLTKNKKLEIVFNKEGSTTKTVLSPPKGKKSQKTNQKGVFDQSTEQKKQSALLQKWFNNQHTQAFSEKEIRRWISLGYQPEDTRDSQNIILQKLGISKKKKQEWKEGKPKKDWFEYYLIKVIEKLKKTSLEKLKTLKNEQK